MKIFKGIYNKDDCDQLQVDINNAYNWTKPSNLKFHPEKCKFMRLGFKQKPSLTYTIGKRPKCLIKSDYEKDIGVTIDSKLNFDQHITSKVNKAYSRPIFTYLPI